MVANDGAEISELIGLDILTEVHENRFHERRFMPRRLTVSDTINI